MKIRHALLPALAVVLGLGVLSGAFAQESHVDDAPMVSRLNEITVTATRHAMFESDAAVAVSVIDGETLREMGATMFEDYLRALPGVNFAEGAAPGQQTLTIRGVNILSDARFQQATSGVYIDELSLTQNGRNPDLDLLDLSRVEVLRGPQGTLFGSSSMGGTVRYITNKPDTRKKTARWDTGLEGVASGGKGYRVNGVVNLPLIKDRLAVRVAGYYKDLPGWIDSVGWAHTSKGTDNRIIDGSLAQEDVNNEETFGGRASLRWNVSNRLNVDVMYLRHNTEVGGLRDENSYWGEGKQQRRFAEEYADEFEAGIATLEYTINAGTLMWASSRTTRHYQRLDDVSNSTPQGFEYWFGGFSDAYDRDIDAFTDSDGDFAGHATYVRPIDWKVTTHEFRFTSHDEGKLHSTLGVYYSAADNVWKQTETYPGLSQSYAPLVPFAFPDFGPPQGSSSYDEAAASDPQLYGTLPSDVGFFSDRRESIAQVSVYGTFVYDITPRWDVTIGARWFAVDIENQLTLGGPAAGTNALLAANELLDTPAGPARDALVSQIRTDAANNYVSTSNPEQSEEGTQLLLGTSYNLTDDVMAYFRFAEGFRPGGINRSIPTRNAETIQESFDSDSLKSYELGWKTLWLDHHVQLNGALYHIDWQDIQIGKADPVTFFGYVENGGKAEIQGAELEFRGRLSPSFEVTASATFIGHEVTEGKDKGYALPYVSNEAYFVSGRYVADVPGGIRGLLRADWSYTGSYETALGNIDGFGLVNLRAALLGEQWRLALFTRNVLNNDAPVFATSEGDGAPEGFVRRVRPRTVGATLTWYF